MVKGMKKQLSVLLALCLLAISFAGCSGSADSVVEAPEAASTESTAATEESAADASATGAANTGAPAELNLEALYAEVPDDKVYVDVATVEMPQPKGEYTVGLAMLNVNTGFFKALADDTKAELESAGVTALLTDCESDATVQVTQIENFITQGVDAIIVNPADPQAAVNIALNKAYDAGIPVISVDLPPDEGAEYLAACITDAYELGYLVGEEIATRLLAENPEGDIEFGIIGGTDGNYIASNRNQGARDAIAAVDTEGRIKEVAFLYAGAYSEESGLKTAENMLVANPNIKAIIGTCDAHVVGATAAAKRQGVDGDLIMGAVDGSKAALDIMKSGGPIKAIGLNSPKEVGQLAARTAVGVLNGDTVPEARSMVLKPTLVTPENVDEYYDENSAF